MFDNDTDNFSGGSDDFGGSQDFESAAPRYPGKQSRRGKGSGKLLIMAICGVLALAAAAILIFVKKAPEPAPDVSGTAAPSGQTEFVDPGIRLITNELLVTMADGTGQRDLEEILQTLDGVVMSSIPEINQFQVRFNTTARDELDGKKTALLEKSGVVRVDYNFMIILEADEDADAVPSISPGSNETVGMLGVLPDPDSGASLLFLPSNGFADREAMKAAGLDDPAGRKAAEALANQRTVIYASGFFYDRSPAGELSRTATTASIRGQIAALVRSGADVVCIPWTAPASDSSLLAGEAEQMQLLLAALEQKNSRFIICKAGGVDDILTRMLSEAGPDHVLTVVPCQALDADQYPIALSGGARDYYQSAGPLNTGNAPVCAPGTDVYQAVSAAAASVADLMQRNPGADAPSLILTAQQGDAAAAFDEDGRVAAVLNGQLMADGSAVNPLPGGARVITVCAEDNISGLPVFDAHLEIDGSRDETMPGGVKRILAGSDSVKVKLTAEGYSDKSDGSISGNNTLHIRMNRTDRNATGTVSGTACSVITDAQGGTQNLSSENVVIRIRDVSDGSEWPEKSVSASFKVTLYEGEYDITVMAHDRTPVFFRGVLVDAGSETVLGDIVLSAPSDLGGIVSGTVLDAGTKAPLADATLTFYDACYPGHEVPDSAAPCGETKSQSDGTYSIELPGGLYTVIASREGYVSTTVSVRSEGETEIGKQDCLLSDTYNFDNLTWVHYDDYDGTHPAGLSNEPKEHVITEGNTVTIQGYTVSAMDEGVRHSFSPAVGFEISGDVDTSTILSHPENGYLTISLGKITAKLNARGGTFELDGQTIATVGNKFHMRLSLTKSGQYLVEIDGKTVADQFIQARSYENVQFGFTHTDHYCSDITKATISDIHMSIPEN